MSSTTLRRPILIAYDGSDGSRRAIEVAGRLTGGGSALACNAWVGTAALLMRADVDELGAPLREAIEEIDEPDAEAAGRAAGEGAELARAAGFDARPLAVHERESAWRALVDTAVSHDARMIVIGTRGRRGVRALLGSVARGVVHHAPVPVLLVPAALRRVPEGPLLLAYDGSQTSRRAIAEAAVLLRGRRAVVFHAWETWVAEVPALARASHAAHGMAGELDEIADHRSAEVAGAGVAAASAAGFDATAMSRETSRPVWRAIVDAGAEVGAAAIVVGSHGMTGIAAVFGGVARGVVHHSDRPVLVVPQAQRSLPAA